MKTNSMRVALLMLVACGLAACGGSDSPTTDPVSCTAPQVLNAAGDGCVDPAPGANGDPEPTSNSKAYTSADTARAAIAGLTSLNPATVQASVKAIYDARAAITAELAYLAANPGEDSQGDRRARLLVDQAAVAAIINGNVKRAVEAASLDATFADLDNDPAAIARVIAAAGSKPILAVFEDSEGKAAVTSAVDATRGSRFMRVDHVEETRTTNDGSEERTAYSSWVLDLADLTPQERADHVLLHNAAEEGRNGMTAAQVLGVAAVKRRIDRGTEGGGRSDAAGTQEVDAYPFSRSVVPLGGETSAPTSATDFEFPYDHPKLGAGDLYCQGTGCAAVVAGANVNLSGTGWFFVPDPPPSPSGLGAVTYVDPDGDGKYEMERGISHFGYWLTGTTGTPHCAKDATNCVVRTFASHDRGKVAAGALDLAERKGGHVAFDRNRATYTGKALGLYAWKKSGGNEAGEFTADVALTATFAGDGSEIGGTVRNFRNTGTEREVGNAWSVTLANETISATGAIGTPNDPGTTTTSSGGLGEGVHLGSWLGQMYGAEQDEMAIDPEGDNRPEGVVGQFDANFRDGYAAGAFGAE